MRAKHKRAAVLQVPQLQLIHSDILLLNLPELLDSLASSTEDR